ncbi:MAG: hypothetical protein ACYDH6_03145 [Acidimicrobiales bacterium]
MIFMYEEPTWGQRAAWLWRELARTPRRAAETVLALALVAGLTVALWPTTVVLTGGGERMVARCGLSYYMTGAPYPSVDLACRRSFNAHFGTALLLFLALAAVTAAVVVDIVRDHRPLAVPGRGPGHSASIPELEPPRDRDSASDQVLSSPPLTQAARRTGTGTGAAPRDRAR